MTANELSNMKLTMGPVLFNWAQEKWRDFYFRIADEAPVDTVCLGEVVCSKREPFFSPLIPEVVERLQSAGKEVVVSSLALVMSRRDLGIVRDVTGMDNVLVEANDVSAISLLKGKPHAIGPLVNVYNEGTLAALQRNGAIRVALPVEMSIEGISALSATVPNGPELEAFCYGRLPLAISARCYHARAHGLSKDGCQYVCERDPDGMSVNTLDGEPFLQVNGVQTMSRSCVNLLGAVPELAGVGVRRLRISPQSWDMVMISKVFSDTLSATMEPEEGMDILKNLTPVSGFSNGYLYGQEGINYYRGSSLA